MDLHQLQLMDAHEHHRAMAVALSLRKSRSEGQAIAERDLYPELVLNRPYSYCIGAVRPVHVLPFFETLIVDLRPLPTPQQFERRYGLSVDDVIALQDQGRLALRIRDHYTKFANLDYLDPLLSRHPPASTRFMHLYQDEYDAAIDSGLSVCPRQNPRGTRWKAEYADWQEPPSFIEVFAGKFALVSCYFGVEYARALVERSLELSDDPADAYDWLHIFSRFRVYPYMNCLEGINTLPVSERLRLPENVAPVPMERRPMRPRFLPYEVGRAVLSNLNLRTPDDWQRAIQVPVRDWMQLLQSLDAALETGDNRDVAETTARVTQELRAIHAEVEQMKRRKRQIQGTFASVGGMGIIGALSDYAPPEWKPIIGMAAGATLAAAGKIANTVVRFRKSSQVIAWFDIRSKLE